jgi:sodium-dependent phosphate cotransporter
LSESIAGVILLLASLVVMTGCLIIMVKILNTLFRGPMKSVIRKTINADFPGKAAFLTGYVAIIVGACVTVLFQSSSVFTSALTPLVGIGVITVERVYPLTLGSNIGTTVTSILAALTADANRIKYTLQISLCHLFFNITGILIFFPVPVMRQLPISFAKHLGSITADYRWFAIFYLFGMFLILPLTVFGLSMAGYYVLIGVGVPIVLLLIFVIIVNILQTKRPKCLPRVLKNWDFLPKPCRSLEPYDRVLTICCKNGKCCRCLNAGSSKVAHLEEVSSNGDISFSNSGRSSTDATVVSDLSSLPHVNNHDTSEITAPNHINSNSDTSGHVNQAFETDNKLDIPTRY